MNRYLTVTAAAAHFNVTERTIRAWIDDGLPAYKVHGVRAKHVRLDQATDHFRKVRARRAASRFPTGTST